MQLFISHRCVIGIGISDSRINLGTFRNLYIKVELSPTEVTHIPVDFLVTLYTSIASEDEELDTPVVNVRDGWITIDDTQRVIQEQIHAPIRRQLLGEGLYTCHPRHIGYLSFILKYYRSR